jgi:hypothetical protein
VKVWVNLPNMASGTVLYGWYGNSGVSTLQTAPTGTWNSNFLAVYHLAEDPSGTAPQINDSTPNANHGTSQGGMGSGAQTAGEVGGSLTFNTSQYVTPANPNNFAFERTDSWSWSAWVYVPAAQNGILLGKITGSTGWAMDLQTATPLRYRMNMGNSGSNRDVCFANPNIALAAWHQVVITYSGSSSCAGTRIYIDGVSQTLTEQWAALTSSIQTTAQAGINGGDASDTHTTATIDEARVYSKGVVLSSGWVAAEYNNQSNPPTFFNVVTGRTPQ